MVYTLEEKQRMDRLLHAFSDYVAQHEYIDIAYTDKTGFVQLSIGESTDYLYFTITGYDDMLTLFIDSHLLNEQSRVGEDLKIDYSHVRKLLSPAFATLGEDEKYCLRFMEEYFEICKKRYAQMHQQNQCHTDAVRKLLEGCPELKIKI